MQKSSATFIGMWSVLGVLLAFVGPAAAADTRVIVGSDFKWTSNGQSSDDGKALVVEGLKVGDVLDVQVQKGTSHGFITIKVLANLDDKNQTTEPVLACGEKTEDKPKAVLREIECGAASNFGHAFEGSMKLEVLATFKDDVFFWCTEHFFGMPGVLKLKP